MAANFSSWDPRVLLQEAAKNHEEGNEAFRNKLYQNAKIKYVRALEVVKMLNESFYWDQRLMPEVQEREKKLLSNLSKALRLLGEQRDAIAFGSHCVKRFPEYAKGHYCLAEAYRDSLPPPPFEMPPVLAIQTIGSAIRHFSEAFKLSRDKQAFYECILIAVPAGLMANLPIVKEPDKRTVFQYSLDVLLQNQRTPLLQNFLQFFLLPYQPILKNQQILQPGCAVGYVNFQNQPLLQAVYHLIDVSVIESLIRHGMPVDVNVLVKIIDEGNYRKDSLIKVMFPALQAHSIKSTTEMRRLLDACVRGRHYDVMTYLLNQGIHFPTEIIAHVMKQKDKMSSLTQLKSLLSKMSTDDYLESAIKLREEGTMAYKNKDYLNARRCYRQALDKVNQAPSVGVVKGTLLEEKQKLLGNLASVERNLRNYDGAISWAKSLVKNFPDNAKGHFRIAEAFRDQSHVKRGGERLKLQICSIESFAKAFELRKESQAYFECLFLAVLTGFISTVESVHLVPVIDSAERIPLGKFVLECLMKRKDEQEDVAKFVDALVRLTGDKQKKVAFPFHKDVVKGELLSVLPTLRLSMDSIKLLVSNGMKVDFNVFLRHLMKGREQVSEFLLSKAQQSALLPNQLSESLRIAVQRKLPSIVELLLQKGAQFPASDMAIRLDVLNWDISILSTAIVKAALNGDVQGISRGKVIEILNSRLQFLDEKSHKEYRSKLYDAARASVVEAIDCYDGIETMEEGKNKSIVKKKLRHFAFLSTIECDAGKLGDAKTYATQCINVDSEFPEGLFCMANVYSAEAKLEQGKTPKAAQLKEHAFRFYLKAFAAKRDKEFFLPMFVMAISEGPDYASQLPVLGHFSKSEVNEILTHTLKCLLDKTQEYPAQLVRSCLLYLLVPKRDRRGYGQGLVNLSPFILSQFVPFLGFNQIAIESLVREGLTVDSDAIVSGIKDLGTTRESEMPDRRSLLLKLCKKCPSIRMKDCLKAAISVKDVELVKHFVSVEKVKIDENNMKAILSWNSSYLLPSLIEVIVKSDRAPLHIKNAKNETIVDIAQRCNMHECVQWAMLKGKVGPVKHLELSVAQVLSKKPSLEVLQAMIDSGAQVSLDALVALHRARKKEGLDPDDCQKMAEIICHSLSKDVLLSSESQKLMSKCIADRFTEMVEILLIKGVTVSDSDACRILSLPPTSLSLPMLTALVKSDLKLTLKNSSGNTLVDIVLKQGVFELLEDIVPRCDALPPCSLASIISKYPLIQIETLSMMIDKGAPLSASGSYPAPLPVLKKILKDVDVKKIPRDVLKNQCNILVLLVEKGADLRGLTEQEPNSPTPVHVATALALQTGYDSILKVVLQKLKFHGSQLLNALGQTPLHEVAKSRCKPTEGVLSLLLDAGVDPKTKDQRKKTALDFCSGRSGKEITYDKLNDYQTRFEDRKREARNKKKKKKKTPVEVQDSSESVPDSRKNNEEMDKSDIQKAPEINSRSGVVQENLTVMVEHSLLVLKQFGMKQPPKWVTKEKNYDEPDANREDSDSELEDSDSDNHSDQEVMQVSEHSKQSSQVTQPQTVDTSQQDFDGLTWEVDCTERFWKNLTKVPSLLRQKAINNICRLASGEWHAKFHKQVGSEPGLDLFEMKLTKGRRILWQKAIDFSPRCSTDSGQIVYSEIIRLWDVVKHKGIQPSIDYIVQSFRKGRDAHVRHILQYIQTTSPKHQANRVRECVPRLFVCSTERHKFDAQYAPAANPGELDYNVITFYAFSSNLVHNVLSRVGERYDFPFKGWPKEHDIINLQAKEPILLLGRSGTGKTTCCVYRLWNQCNSYWASATEPYIPRVPLLFTKSSVQNEEQQHDVVIEDDDKQAFSTNSAISKHQTNIPHITEPTYGDKVVFVDKATVEQEEWYGGWQEQVSNVKESDQPLNKDKEESIDDNTTDGLNETPLDHLQQVFITKNPVLVSQVQKKFYDLASSSPHMSAHMKFEAQPVPVRFQDIPSEAYPLFVTSFQWLNLLDASLVSGKSFFPRDDSGNLLVQLVDSAGEFSTNPDDIELSDESDPDSNDDEADLASYTVGQEVTTTRRQRVVDSAYFCDTIWQQITKTHVHFRKQYDPLLVWMEIRSFLKGSYEALMVETGALSLKQYMNIGAKRAVNFSGDRSEVYMLFELYQKYLSQHHLMDQCDWVFSIFWRLKEQEDVHVVLHEVYIDEVQDFTQAELYLILHCCRFPNGLFLTGDTAQSIMRGVSFRFKDLRSLFHHFRDSYLKEKGKKMLTIPTINTLEQNFRSHSGILEVAATVIKLLQLFFPKSIDTLPEDCGLFPGPKPIILHSVSESDLAIILRGNRREASTIEFGAHQAILVQTEDAKRTIPNELSGAIVLTVFEAKGLEFDDVLLYNFFSDSKTDQEWRLSLDLLKLGSSSSGHEYPFLDKSVLRSLEFDEKLHRSFSAELKYLYTAITRAKCNLWIYDANPLKFSPLIYVLLTLGQVSAISLTDISEEEVTTVFVKESSAEEWMKRGAYFMKKKLWEPANKCFLKCGNQELAMEANAFRLISEARKVSGQPKIRRQYCLDAARLFLKCASSPDTMLYRYLKYAATCLYNGQQWELAAQVFESIEEWSKAFKAYHQAKCYEKASVMKERLGQYCESLQYLCSAGRYPLALKAALRYQKQNLIIDNPNLSVEDLAYQTAKHHKNRQEFNQMKECVSLLPDIGDKIRILNLAGEYNEVVRLLVEAERVKEAYHILASQKQYDTGIKLAQDRNDGREVLKFHLMKARSSKVVRAAIKDIRSRESLELSTEAHSEKIENLRDQLLPLLGDMNKAIEKYGLRQKCQLRVVEKTLLESVCHLKVDKIRRLRMHEIRNSFARMDQLSLLVNLTPPEAVLTDQLVHSLLQHGEDLISKCTLLSQLKAVPPVNSTTTSALLSELQEWYGLQLDSSLDSFSIYNEQDLWITFSGRGSSDGTTMLGRDAVINCIQSHIYHSIQRWLKCCEPTIVNCLNGDTFTAYHQVCNDLAMSVKIEAHHLKHFIQFMCFAVQKDIVFLSTHLSHFAFHGGTNEVVLTSALNVLDEDDVRSVKEKFMAKDKSSLLKAITKTCGKSGWKEILQFFPETYSKWGKTSCKLLVQYFSPILSYYIPLSGQHYKMLCQFPSVHDAVLSYGNMLTKATRDVNAFMSVWWMRGSVKLQDQLNQCRLSKNHDLLITDRYNKEQCHGFLLWLMACSQKEKPLVFCKYALGRFCSFVLQRREVKKKFSPTHMIPLLELLSTTLISMLVCQEDQFRGQHTDYMACLPHKYDHIVQVFEEASWKVGTPHRQNRLLNLVYKSVCEDKNIRSTHEKTRAMLIEVAEIMFGMSSFGHFNVLAYVLKGIENSSNGLVQRSITLSLVLLANLEFFADNECRSFRKKILSILSTVLQNPPQEKIQQEHEFYRICNHSYTTIEEARGTQDLIKFLTSLCGPNSMVILRVDSLRSQLQFVPLQLELFKNVAFQDVAPFLSHLPPTSSDTTPWPTWEGGEALYPSESPHISSYTRREPYDDEVNVDDEEESLQLEDNDSGRMSEVEKYINHGVCIACGYALSSVGEEGEYSTTGMEHIESDMHIMNKQWFDKFEEQKSMNTVYSDSQSTLKYSSELPRKSRQVERLEENLKREISKLQSFHTPNLPGVMTDKEWRQRCEEYEKASEEVNKLLVRLKEQLPVLSGQTQQRSQSQSTNFSDELEEDIDVLEYDDHMPSVQPAIHKRRKKGRKK